MAVITGRFGLTAGRPENFNPYLEEDNYFMLYCQWNIQAENRLGGSVKSKKLVLKIIGAAFVLASTLFWISKVDGMITEELKAASECVILDDAWDITINDNAYPDVLLTEFRFPAVRKGDRITMQRVLPSDWELVEGALRFYVRHNAVRMYIDGSQIYEYGNDRLAAGKTLGSGYQFVKFPGEYKGKTLRIELVMAEDKVFTKLDSVRIYEWGNAYRLIATEGRLPLFCGSFLVLFGLIVCAITAVALIFSSKYVRLFCISVFSVCMGLWTLSYYNIMQIFTIPLYSVSLINYLALYLAPIPLTVYIREEVENLKNRILKIFYRIFLVAEVTAVCAAIFFHALDIVHMAGILNYMQAVLMSGLLFFLVVLLMNLKFSKPENSLSVAGLLVVVVCVVYDMLGYHFGRYLGSDAFNLKGVSSCGIMIFICILFVSFYLEMTQRMMEQKERDYLIKSAYTDELTRLNNRRYCMEYMMKLKEHKNFEYTVICFDVNNLKIINDTFGHARGDVLLKCAAEVLEKTFGEQGFVARMGGDEFVAIIRTAEEVRIRMLIEQFLQNVSKKNQTVKDLNMSIAYGYACGSQSSSEIEKVYQKADDNMYEKKKQMKA